MSYQLTEQGSISIPVGSGSVMFLPPENNGTPEWRAYQDWLDAGNTPAPYVAPPPGPDYLAFWDALMGSTVYASIRTQSMASLPMNTLATEFIALIGDAKAGRANETAIQQSITAILDAGTFTEDDLDQFQTLLELGNLDTIYTLGGAS